MAAVSDRPEYLYTLRWSAPNAHFYYIDLETVPSVDDYTDFQLPKWRPGRYILQDYAAGISAVVAEDQTGQELQVRKTGTHTWRVTHSPNLERIKLSYRFYADKIDAGSSYRGQDIAYFNGINMFMHTGDRTRACRLRVPEIPENWKVASALPGKRGEYTTDSYHELVDCPTIMGKDIHTVSFEVLGKPMHVHFAGRWDGNEEMDKQIQRDFAAIAREQAAIFGGELPFEEYHHIYFLVPYYYRHAVEHKNSAMYVLPETHGQSPQKLRGLYGITSHEFFHVWNVKRIRPSAMWPYDYSQEAPTRLHWFTEGVTDYYAYIALTRAEVWDQDDYFGHISNLLTRLENDHGPTETAPSESSFNSWLARSDYHHPHHRASYYALGTRVALLLDMRIRTVTDGQRSFDDVFRLLWDLYYQKDRGVPEDGVLDAINTVAEADLSADYEALVNGTAPIDYARYLEPVNLNVQITQTPEVAGHKKLGIEKLGKMSDFVTLQTIHPESDAFKAGLMEGDILIAFNGKTVDQNSAESVFEGIEVGNTYRMKVQRWHEALTFDVTYTGESVPVKAELVDQAPSKERYNWLETHFKGIKAGTEPESAR